MKNGVCHGSASDGQDRTRDGLDGRHRSGDCSQAVGRGCQGDIAGRSKAKLDEAVERSRTSGGARVHGVLVDAASAEGAGTLLEAAAYVDILVNNLGIYEIRNFVDISDAEWRTYFDVNVLAESAWRAPIFRGCCGRTGAASSSSPANWASSPRGHDPLRDDQDRPALGVAGFADLTKGTRVTVNSVLPGPTRSDGLVAFMKSRASDPQAPTERIEGEFFAKGRPSSSFPAIEPDEIANMVAFVASPLSAATNGAALRVDGGLIDHRLGRPGF